MEHHEAILALLERFTTAVAGHDVPGADPEHVTWGHVGSHKHWRHELQGIADEIFGEGEYAEAALRVWLDGRSLHVRSPPRRAHSNE